jgi:predicted nucleic acid-binding Zn ribbon protein
MPKYDYICSICSISIEFERAFGEDREPVCCNQAMNRQWGSFGVQFKGNGFYSTDNRK